MAAYITNEPKYNEHLDINITRCIGKVLKMMDLCREIREPLQEGGTDHVWYHYREDVRKIYDAVALVEHDVFLLTHYITKISEKVWALYYKEHPDEIGQDHPVIFDEG